MKTTLFALTAVLCSLISNAQSKSTTSLFNNNQVAAIEINIPFETGIVEKAIQEKMYSFNVKSRDQKGFRAYHGAKIDSICEQEIDLYFKVSRKDKKNKDASVVTLLVSQGFETFITPASHPKEFDRAKIFMNSFLQTSSAADIDVQINSQDDAVKKADKRLETLKDELNELRKKMKYTSEKLADTEKEILKQEDLLRKEKEIQASLHIRRAERS